MIPSIVHSQNRLVGQKDGSFIVRDSSGYFGTLTLVHRGQLYQTHIEETSQGRGTTHPTLIALMFDMSLFPSILTVTRWLLSQVCD